MRRLLLLLFAAGLLLAVAVVPVLAQRTVPSGRVAGATRVETAVAVAQRAFPDGAAAAYLARADDFADALAAGALRDGPVLLVPSCGALPDVVAAELARLAPDEVLALGGPAAVCDELLAQAATAAGTSPDREEPVVLWETADGTYRTSGHSQADLERIRAAIAAGEPAGIPNGELRLGDGGVNVGHAWHVVDVELADVTAEYCDATVAYVDEHLEEWYEQVGRFCPWSAVPLAVEE